MAHSSLGRGTRTGTAGGTWQSGLGGWARASDTRSPARHCSSMISLAFGLGAAEIRALTSANSKYSGSLKPFFRINCCNVPPLGLIPRGPLMLSAVVLMGPRVTKGALLLHSGISLDQRCNPALCELWAPTFAASTNRRRSPKTTALPSE